MGMIFVRISGNSFNHMRYVLVIWLNLSNKTVILQLIITGD